MVTTHTLHMLHESTDYNVVQPIMDMETRNTKKQCCQHCPLTTSYQFLFNVIGEEKKKKTSDQQGQICATFTMQKIINSSQVYLVTFTVQKKCIIQVYDGEF